MSSTQFYLRKSKKVYLKYEIDKVSLPCEKMLMECRFGGYKFDCNDIFLPKLTDEGLCCTFNGLIQKFMAKPIEMENFGTKLELSDLTFILFF